MLLYPTLLSTGPDQVTSFHLGGPEYVAAPADYDGAGKADPGIYAEPNGVWYGRLSGHNWEWFTARFGGPGYQPVSE